MNEDRDQVRTASMHDLSVLGVGLGAALILAGIVFALGLAWAMIDMRQAWPSGANQPVPVPSERIRGPVLESAPARDRDAYEQDKRARLNAYGWSDRAQGRVHVPIALAMRLLAQRRAVKEGGR